MCIFAVMAKRIHTVIWLCHVFDKEKLVDPNRLDPDWSSLYCAQIWQKWDNILIFGKVVTYGNIAILSHNLEIWRKYWSKSLDY